MQTTKTSTGARSSSTRTTKATPTLTLCEMGASNEPGLESYSPFCIKIHRALSVLGLPYQRRIGQGPDEFEQFNPAKQVPVLLVDETPVADSTLILEKLIAITARRRPAAPSLLPTDALIRGEAWLWEELADTALNGFVVAARWADPENWPRCEAAYFAMAPAHMRSQISSPIRERVLGALYGRDVIRSGLPASWERFGRLLDQLDSRAPASGYWMGKALSVADIGLFAQLHSLGSHLTPGQAAEVRSRKTLYAYLTRVDDATRPSFKD